MKAERLYEQARKELADSPKEELLRKSISEADGDEEKGKALYVEARVKELEDDLEDRLVHSTSCALEETIKSLWPDYDKEVKEMLEEEEEYAQKFQLDMILKIKIFSLIPIKVEF